MTTNPILPILSRQGVLILDGGLSNALEARGCDLNHPLWTARVLMEEPEVVRRVHLDYLEAGADCIATTSYQASFPGFEAEGISEEEGEAILRLSSALALEARDAFWGDPVNRVGRCRPLVAASVGPYGAYLADGSEYTGDYGISQAQLREFHEKRWRILADSGVDLMACETFPSMAEVQVILDILRETPHIWAWVSFTCRDELHLRDGGLLRDAAALCQAEARVAAVGINCTDPELTPRLIQEARTATEKPILVYPNSGERYDAGEKVWHAAPSSVDWERDPRAWLDQGCSGIGGCCRVGPERIAGLRTLLLDG